MAGVVVGTYNVHGGVDGWGRPFDVVEACRRVAADILVLQESWAPDGGVSTAARVAEALGYHAVEVELARGRIVPPPADAGEPWGPHLWARSPYGLRLLRRHPRPPTWRPGPHPGAQRGGWGIAVLSRLPFVASSTIDLEQLPTDPSRRRAIVLDVAVEGAARPLLVVGTHLPHLRQGSPRHIAALRRALHAEGMGAARHHADGPQRAGVLLGDMNVWGPPLVFMLPGWRRAVVGRTWPTWAARPLAQSDHILVSGIDRAAGHVLPIPGSDHFPVRAELTL